MMSKIKYYIVSLFKLLATAYVGVLILRWVVFLIATIALIIYIIVSGQFRIGLLIPISFLLLLMFFIYRYLKYGR